MLLFPFPRGFCEILSKTPFHLGVILGCYKYFKEKKFDGILGLYSLFKISFGGYGVDLRGIFCSIFWAKNIQGHIAIHPLLRGYGNARLS
jgi:hypothetical protein